MSLAGAQATRGCAAEAGNVASSILVLTFTPRAIKDGNFKAVEPSAPYVVVRAVEAGDI